MRATANERSVILPGDNNIKDPAKIITHAITIDALPETIWPWLVQLGSGRSGWYSYDRIDNGGIPSSIKIIPELQHITVGDIMPAIPGTKDAFIIQEIHINHAIVLVVPIQTSVEEQDPLKRMSGPLRVSWVLALQPNGDGSTRLISRGRISRNWLAHSLADSTLPKKLIFIERIYSLLAMIPWQLMLPIAMAGHTFMESRMLRGIKQRAEKKESKQEYF